MCQCVLPWSGVWDVQGWSPAERPSGEASAAAPRRRDARAPGGQPQAARRCQRHHRPRICPDRASAIPCLRDEDRNVKSSFSPFTWTTNCCCLFPTELRNWLTTRLTERREVFMFFFLMINFKNEHSAETRNPQFIKKKVKYSLVSASQMWECFVVNWIFWGFSLKLWYCRHISPFLTQTLIHLYQITKSCSP